MPDGRKSPAASVETAGSIGVAATPRVFLGGQYTSAEFQGWGAGNNVTQSMGKVGVCWDNAVAENFLSHLKTGLAKV